MSEWKVITGDECNLSAGVYEAAAEAHGPDVLTCVTPAPEHVPCWRLRA
jgi:hypothetical protein